MRVVKDWNPGKRETRIVLVGPPLAGKSEILRAACRHFGFPLELSLAGDPKTVVTSITAPEWIAATYSGAVWSPGLWEDLVRWSNAVLFVIDPQRERESAVREMLALAAPLLENRALAVQVTKGDLVASRKFRVHCFSSEVVTGYYGLNERATFFSSIQHAAKQPVTLLGGLLHLAGPCQNPPS